MHVVVLVTNRWLNKEVKLSAAGYPEAIQALQTSSSPQLILPYSESVQVPYIPLSLL